MNSESKIYDRPFVTYKEQIEKLRDIYGLRIEDESFAIHALSTISYYDLVNGYQECFMPSGTYINGITLEYLYNFHLFDKDFQNILIKHSLLIENIFKTKLSYIIAKNIGVEAENYLNQKHYKRIDKNPTSNQILEKIKNVYKIKTEYVDNPTKHYIKTKNHIPPWILFKNVSFVSVIELFSILSTKEKYELTNEIIPSDRISYSMKVEHLKNSLTIIRKFRNKIAHNLKFITFESKGFNLNSKVIHELCPHELITNKEGIMDKEILRVYKFLLAIVTFYNDNPYLLNRLMFDMFQHLKMDSITNRNKNTFNEYHIITALPADLESRIEKYIDNLGKNISIKQ